MGCLGSNPDKAALEAECRGKSKEQKQVIEYFCKEEGCLSKNITDDTYLQMVQQKRDSLNLKAKALGKIGLDEEEISEIPPAMFEGFVFKNAYAKQRANGTLGKFGVSGFLGFLQCNTSLYLSLYF